MNFFALTNVLQEHVLPGFSTVIRRFLSSRNELRLHH